MQILDLWKNAFVLSGVFFFLTVLTVLLCTIATNKKRTIIGALIYLLAYPMLLIPKCDSLVGLAAFILKLIFLLNSVGITLW